VGRRLGAAPGVAGLRGPGHDEQRVRATLGRLEYGVTREEAIGHAATIVPATSLPVSADLENGFGDAPEDCAETVRQALGAGLAGCSIEDSTGREDQPVYDKQ
jgi:2-methylisocitrate lyase-like PEP mutase family enzyme